MAVAAIASVWQILEKTLHHQHLILCDRDREDIDSLLQQVSFIQDSLNKYYPSSIESSEIVECLEREIINAANKARDVIQSQIMDQLIRDRTYIASSQLFDQVLKKIEFIDQEVRKIQEDSGVQDPRPQIYSYHSGVQDPRPLFYPRSEDYERIYWQLVVKSDDKLRILSVVGTAGIGKTTLAKTVYSTLTGPNYHFDIGAWTTVSHTCGVRQIIINLLDSINMFTNEIHQESTEILGEYLYNSLKGQRYFIVLDDIWDAKVWDDLIRLFPDDHNRSRILLTTRLESVAVYTDSSSQPHCMNFNRQIQHRRNLVLENGLGAEFLLNKVSSLQDLLETSSHKGGEKAKSLKNQIIEAAKELKSLSESCVVEYNLTFSPHCLMEVKEEIDFIKQMVMRIDKSRRSAQDLQLSICSSKPAAHNVVGLHGDFMEIKNRLARESPRLEVISLVGMGGIGKTTLASEVYRDKFILEFFIIRAWVAISQSYDLKQILIGLLDSLEKLPNHEEVHKSSAEDLGEHLYRCLKGRRYLIVVDDVWDIKIWEYLRRLFPDDKNSSRILLTTRLEHVAICANSFLHHMHFLDDDASWILFCNKVFGENCCPPELDEIGKKIVQNCQGLPLAIIVIGGLISRGSKTQCYWKNIAEYLNSGMFSNDDRCSKMLSLSHIHLPQHLKRCFVYTGIFPEDYSISVSKLVKLWIAEGFLEPLKSNSLEDIAYEYLLDLVHRSLILVDKQSCIGRIKTCKVHDIVRDFCMRNAGRTCFVMLVMEVSVSFL